MEIMLPLQDEEIAAVHLALYMRLNELAMIEDHNPDAGRRAQARRDAAPILRVADMLRALRNDLGPALSDDELRQWENNRGEPQ
jgi:hypothetical protein